MGEDKHFNTADSSRVTKLRKERSKDGQFYYTMIAGNGEIVGTSEMYPTEDHVVRAMETLEARLDSGGVDIEPDGD